MGKVEMIENLKSVAFFLESIGEDVSADEIRKVIEYMDLPDLGDF